MLSDLAAASDHELHVKQTIRALKKALTAKERAHLLVSWQKLGGGRLQCCTRVFNKLCEKCPEAEASFHQKAKQRGRGLNRVEAQEIVVEHGRRLSELIDSLLHFLAASKKKSKTNETDEEGDDDLDFDSLTSVQGIGQQHSCIRWYKPGTEIPRFGRSFDVDGLGADGAAEKGSVCGTPMQRMNVAMWEKFGSVAADVFANHQNNRSQRLVQRAWTCFMATLTDQIVVGFSRGVSTRRKMAARQLNRAAVAVNQAVKWRTSVKRRVQERAVKAANEALENESLTDNEPRARSSSNPHQVMFNLPNILPNLAEQSSPVTLSSVDLSVTTPQETDSSLEHETAIDHKPRAFEKNSYLKVVPRRFSPSQRKLPSTPNQPPTAMAGTSLNSTALTRRLLFQKSKADSMPETAHQTRNQSGTGSGYIRSCLKTQKPDMMTSHSYSVLNQSSNGINHLTAGTNTAVQRQYMEQGHRGTRSMFTSPRSSQHNSINHSPASVDLSFDEGAGELDVELLGNEVNSPRDRHSSGSPNVHVCRRLPDGRIVAERYLRSSCHDLPLYVAASNRPNEVHNLPAAPPIQISAYHKRRMFSNRPSQLSNTWQGSSFDGHDANRVFYL